MFTQMRFNLKFLGAIFFALVFLVGGFFINNIAKAAAPGDVIINEFVSNSSQEWIELLNTTNNSIDLTGWKIQDFTFSPEAIITGTHDNVIGPVTIPANGIITIDVTGLNNNADSITLYDNTSPTPIAINNIVYGTVATQTTTAGLETAPGSDRSAAFYSGSWHSDNAPTKGWFNDTSNGAPAWNTIIAPFCNPNPGPCVVGIASNITSADNPSSISGLYFEKTGLGKISLANTINMTDQTVVAKLQNLGTAMDMSGGHIEFDSSTASAMNAAGATLYMYGLSFPNGSTPNILVNGNPSTDSDIGSVSYLDGNLSFTAKHFTTFDVDNTITVTTPTELTDAIANATSGATILVNGILGSTDAFTIYEVTTSNITIKGVSGNKIYGTFNLKGDGDTLDSLNIYSRGGGSNSLKNAVNVVSKSVNITNCTFEMPNPAEVAAGGGVGNGVVIWPYGSATPNLNITGNSFVGYGATVPGWASTALLIAEEIDMSRVGMGGIMSTTINLNNEQSLATNNTFTGSYYDYVHSNWNNGYKLFYSKVSNAAALLDVVEDSAADATILIAPGDYNLQKDDVTLVSGQTGWYLPITKNNITLQGVDANGQVITNASNVATNIYSTQETANGSWPSQDLIAVFGDNVTIRGLGIMNKISPNKAIEVMGNNFKAENCKFTPISSTLFANISNYHDITDNSDNNDISKYGSGVYFNNNGATEARTGTITDNIFINSGITFDSFGSNWTMGITGNTFDGNKVWSWTDNTGLHDQYYSSIGATTWANQPNFTGSTININENKFINMLSGQPLLKIKDTMTGTFNAINNWWGNASGPATGTIIGNTINFAPYYIDETKSTTSEQLATAKTDAHSALTTALGTYIQGNYTAPNWTTLTGFKTTGDTNIDAATNITDVTSAQNTATAGMSGVAMIMTGEVMIDGTAKYGETLTADISGLHNAGNPTYQWNRNWNNDSEGDAPNGATSSTYVLGLSDIGKTISVTVTAESGVGTGSLSSTKTAVVNKANGPVAPVAPVLSSKTSTNITLVANTLNEFSKDNGTTWQDNVFSELTASTDYTFVTRVKETETANASASSSSIGIKTLDVIQTPPDENGNVNLSGDTSEVVITNPIQEVNVLVGSGTTNPTIDVNAFVNTATVNEQTVVTGTLPAINIDTTVADVSIPATTVVTGPANWDGVISAPTSGTPTGGNAPSGFSVGDTVITVGSALGTLTFDNAVTLILPGVTGAVGYRPSGSNTWTQITNVCGGDYANPTNPTMGGECYRNNGTDTKIVTYHFTTFGELNVVHGSSGSYIRPVAPAVPANVTTPDGCAAGNKFSTTTGRNCNAATPAGKVLGAEKFNFTKFMKNGSKGDEIIELQNLLTSLGYDCGTADGKFGPKTKGAVIKFQKANKLVGDGVVGKNTRALLNK